MTCKKCPQNMAGQRKFVPGSYQDAHAAWHKRGMKPRRTRTRNAETAENLRLSRARRRQTKV